MYPEFIAIYVGLLIIIGLLITILVLILKKQKNNQSFTNFTARQNNFEASNPARRGVVFCKKCATEFDPTQRYCPKCGAPR